MINKFSESLKNYGVLTTLLFLLDQIRVFARATFYNSYTPFGEDVIIDKLLNEKKQGFYVDIGAHDPSHFSITKRFYDKGWRGINIEPHPYNAKKFKKERGYDTNLNIGIANKNVYLEFFKFENKSLSTFSAKVAKSRQKFGYRLVEAEKIKVTTLRDVLSKYAPNTIVDFFNIDTEGFDDQVLKSNDWVHFRPKVLCIEISSLVYENPNCEKPKKELFRSITHLTKKLGYREVAKTDSNIIFLDSQFN